MSTTESLYIPENAVLAMLVEKAKTAFNDDVETSARIHRGAYLVETGAVDIMDYDEQGNRPLFITVTSKGSIYPVGKGCPCRDMQLRKAPCKHLFAKWLAIRVVQFALQNN